MWDMYHLFIVCIIINKVQEAVHLHVRALPTHRHMEHVTLCIDIYVYYQQIFKFMYTKSL